MWLIDKICDILYPRPPGEPDRASIWAKLCVLGMFAALLVIGCAGSGRW